MDTNFSEKFEELLLRCQQLSSEVEALRAEIEALKASEPATYDEEPIDIDISIDDEEPMVPEDPVTTEEAAPVATEEEEPVTLSEAEGSPSLSEAAPSGAGRSHEMEWNGGRPGGLGEACSPSINGDDGISSDSDDMPESLFGDAPEPVESTKGRRRNPKAVYQAASAPKTVVDAMTAKAAWRSDMPGPEVRSLRSAIALGDQVIFINRLFRKDSALYQTTIDTLNNTATLSAAIDYLSETFPEWDLESEDVYRFMMAVRRKIRK